VAWTSDLRVGVGPGAAALRGDGSAFAYTIDGRTAGTSTHLYVARTDRTLFTEPMLGGHGGPPYGPVGQLEFSADGRYLLEYELFRPQPAPPNFLVYARDGSLAFQSAGAKFGAWAPSGSTLYFLVSSQQGGIGGEVHSWTPSGGEVTVARGLTTYFWPRAAPTGRVLVFDAYDTSAPGEATGGLPHLWQLDLSTGTARQLSTASSTKTVFVGATSLWSDEETRCSCGPGGASMPTGRVLPHDLASGHDAVVDLTPLTLIPSSVRVVLDVSPN